MNPLKLLSYVTHQSEAWHELADKKPSVQQMLLMYVVPLSIIPPLMLYFVVQNHPKIFMDILPGDRLIIFGLGLFFSQVTTVLVTAWITQHLAKMVDIKPSFRDALLVIAAAATPFWLVSIFYLVPSFTVNIALHGVAGLVSAALVNQGIISVFKLKRRGAAIMLLIAIICTAALGLGILLIGTLMSWGGIQDLQFSLKKP